MIDTLRWYVSKGCYLSQLAQSIVAGGSGCAPDWAYTHIKSRKFRGCEASTCSFTHRTYGIVITTPGTGDYAMIQWSVSRVLYATNDVLPGSDQQVVQAKVLVKQMVQELVTLDWESGHFTRVDCTCYVAIPPYELIPLLEKVRHPAFRRLPIIYPGESLTYKGSRHRLIFYDKLRESGNRGFALRTRVELRLVGGAKLQKHFGLSGGNLTKVSVAQAYHALRSCLLCYGEVKVAPEYTSDNLIAWCALKNITAPDGRHIIEWRVAGLRPEPARKKRSQLAAVMMHLSGLDFGAFLPESPTFEEWFRLLGGVPCPAAA